MSQVQEFTVQSELKNTNQIEAPLFNLNSSITVNAVCTGRVYIAVQQGLQLCHERITGFRQEYICY